ncbi:sensor histidine kinase [Dactylosporangium sp. NPDC051541]|uniref:sensor histidine kinase n=1 Tax=Dactylosporangium sp. NPDC051541 TaxID=3363977 RepID=UPI00379DE087
MTGCRTGDQVTVTVSDAGIGIPTDQYPHLFTRFFRASTAVAHGIKGTGLGLALTKAIAEAHHGTITVSPNTERPGTTFTVTLPAATGTIADEPTSAA